MASTSSVPPHLAALYAASAAKFETHPAFCSRQPNGEFKPTSYRELYETGLNIATALIELGVKAREHVGLFADNRLEWILCDCGILCAGAADVPRGTDVTDGEITYILDHADVRVVFVENLATLAKLESCRKELRKIERIILMDPKVEAPKGILALRDLMDRGAKLRAGGDTSAEERMAGIQPDDLFTIIYTSGTTGTPKGVQLTNANMMSQIRNLPLKLYSTDRTLALLPIWHSYERVFEVIAVAAGVTTYYTSLRAIGDDLKKVRPTLMVSAPRLWESLYQKMLASLKSASPFRRGLFHLTFNSACKVKRAEAFFRGKMLDLEGRRLPEKLRLAAKHAVGWITGIVPYQLLDGVVLGKLRAVVGGQFRGTISGGGALQPHVDEFFNFVGIPVLEGYGMTETSPVLAVRNWDNLVIGTVGYPFPETEVRIVDLNTGEILYPNKSRRGEGRGLRGEIHVKGPQVMKGYYKNPEATARVLREGWMNTGDIGMVTYNHCLKILGRSKDTIVLLSGENVEPLPIEGRLVESPLIEQCMVVGQDQKFLAVLIVPSLEGFRRAGVHAANSSELAGNARVKELLDAEIRRLISVETGFKPFERLADWRLIPKTFEVGDELTNTFKIKRHVVTQQYQYLIDDIYS